MLAEGMPAAEDHYWLSKEDCLVKYGATEWKLFEQMDERREQAGYGGKRYLNISFLGEMGWDMQVRCHYDEVIS